MSIFVANQIKRDLRIYAQNDLCNLPIRAKCMFCVSTGKPAIIHTIWKYYMHMTFHHATENYQEICHDLMKKIVEDMKL